MSTNIRGALSIKHPLFSGVLRTFQQHVQTRLWLRVSILNKKKKHFCKPGPMVHQIRQRYNFTTHKKRTPAIRILSSTFCQSEFVAWTENIGEHQGCRRFFFNRWRTVLRMINDTLDLHVSFIDTCLDTLSYSYSVLSCSLTFRRWKLAGNTIRKAFLRPFSPKFSLNFSPN